MSSHGIKTTCPSMHGCTRPETSEGVAVVSGPNTLATDPLSPGSYMNLTGLPCTSQLNFFLLFYGATRALFGTKGYCEHCAVLVHYYCLYVYIYCVHTHIYPLHIYT